MTRVRRPRAGGGRLLFELVEPRVLLSADLLGLAGLPGSDPDGEQAPWEADGVDAAQLLAGLDGGDNGALSRSAAAWPADPGLPSFTELHPEDDAGGEAGFDEPWQLLGAMPDAAGSSEAARELVIVDARVPDYQDLVETLAASRNGDGLQIAVLDPERDGVEQIGELLSGRQDVAALYIVSHGNDDGLQLGATWLTGDNLDEYIEALSAWGEALAADADLLLYGCNIAADSDGRALVELIGELTGADVAASTDPTGHESLGGDWDLEYRSGSIDVGPLVAGQFQAQWDHVLALKAYEGFDYATGSLESQGGGSGWSAASVWTTHSGNPAQVTAAGLADPGGGLPVGGGAAEMNGSGSLYSQSRDMDAVLGAEGTTAWVSFLLKADVTGVGGISLELGDSADDTVTIGISNDDFLLTRNRSMVGASYITDVVSDGQTYLLVAKLEFAAGDDTVTLYVDPTAGLSGPDSAQTAQLSSADLGTFTEVGMVGGFTGNTTTVDEIRIGDSFADVAPAELSLSPVQDTYIYNANPADNYGGDSVLRLYESGGGYGDGRSLLQFDLDSLPVGATVTGATLQMEAVGKSNSGSSDIHVFAVTEAWDEGSGGVADATWNNRQTAAPWATPGGSFDTTALASLTASTTGTHRWDVTDLVGDWHTGARVNHGLMLASDDTGSVEFSYDSREGVTPPQLLISYHLANLDPTLSAFSNPVETTDEDTEVEISFADLAAQGDENDGDGTVDSFVVESVTSGTLKIGADAATATAWVTGSNDTIGGANKAYWTPDANANGTLDAFAVVALDDDDAESAAAVSAQVSVTPVNDAPAGADHTVIAAKNDDYVFSAADFGLTDSNDDPANALAAVRIASLPATGSLTLTGSGAVSVGQYISRADIDAGRFLFTPVADTAGSDYASFDFQVQDDGGSTNGGVDLDPVADTLTIDVLAFPVDARFDGYATDEDTPLVVSVPGLLDNDRINLPNYVSGATLEYLAGGDTDGDLVWQNETAQAGYGFDLSGGGVTRIDDPVGAAPGITAAYVFDGNGGGVVGTGLASLPGDPTNEDATFEMLFRPSDGVGQEILFESGDSHGISLKLNDTTLELYVGQGLFGDLQTFDMSAAIAANSYIHVFVSIDVGVLLDISDWSSSDGFAIGQADGGVALSSAGADPFQGEIALFRFYDSPLSPADKQQNFDAVKDLDVVAVTTSGSGVDAGFNADGSFTYDPGATFDYLQAGESAIDTFTYTVEDSLGRTDTATVAVTINGVNDDPTGSGGLSTTSLNDNAGPTALFGGLSIQDVDAGEGDLVLRIQLSEPAAGTINGGGFVDQGGGVYLRGGLTVDQANGALDSVKFAPADSTGSSGSFSTDVSVSVDDQGGAGEQTVLAPTTVTVNRVNDAPVFTGFADGVATTDEDTEVEITLATLKNLGDELDVDGTVDGFRVKSLGSGTLRIGADAFSATPWSNGGNDLIDATNKAYWTPGADAHGPLSAFVAAAVDDAGAESTGSATALVSVRPVNDVPTFTSSAPTAGTEELEYSYSITTDDVDGDPLTISASTLPGWLTLVDHGDGSATLSGTPADAEVGANGVVLRVSDGTAGVDQAFTITVAAVNDLPVLTDSSLTIAQGGTVTLGLANLSATDVDDNDADLVFEVSKVEGGHFALNGDPKTAVTEFTQAQVSAGEVLFVDDGDRTAPSFLVRVKDGAGSSAAVAAEVDFTPRSIAPTVTEPKPVTKPELEVVAEPEPVPEPEVESKPDAKESVAGEAAEPTEAPAPIDTQRPAPVEVQVSDSLEEGRDGTRPAAEQSDYRPEFRLERMAQAVGTALRTDWFNPAEYLIESLRSTEQFKQFEQLLGSDELRDNLDRVRGAMDELHMLDQTVVGSTAAVSTGLSVGYVAWLLRGGVLLSTVVSSMPAWNLVDPLPVLASTRKAGAEEDDDSLEDIIKKRRASADDRQADSAA